MKLQAFIHGIYPRSEQLVSASRDFDRKRKTERQLVSQQKADLASLTRLQTELGFDYIEDGKLSWQDIFRPLVESCPGLQAGALSRWFDNNTFFRQPVVVGKLSLDKEKLNQFFPKISKGSWKVTLPSPFCFAKLVYGQDSFSKTLPAVTSLLAEVINHLEKRGVAMIQLNEPYLGYHGAKKTDISLFIKSISALMPPKRRLKLGVHFYFGDCRPLISALFGKLPVDALGIDFYKTSLSGLPGNFGYELIAGVVEGRNSLLERQQVLLEFTQKLAHKLNPPKIYLSNNSDLELLPEAIARKKLVILAKVSKKLGKKI